MATSTVATSTGSPRPVGVQGNVLLGQQRSRPAWTITVADGAAASSAYRALRHQAFVVDQAMFERTDLDELDDDPRTVVLVARDRAGVVLGGVRLGPALDGPDIGWWVGGRLVVDPASTTRAGVAAALVRAACAHAEQAGVLRFEASVQPRHAALFTGLGWEPAATVEVAGRPHLLVRWPVDRVHRLAASSKSALGPLLAGMHLGGAGFVGDDGAPVPGSDLVAACDAILPSLVERDPEWAGWCAVLVNANDLAAMGAEPVGMLDALGARDASFAARVLSGLRRGSAAYRLPVLGGHTQLGVPASLSVTALGRTDRPVPAGGGRVGDPVSLTADLGGGWRAGQTGRQWDSTTSRTTEELALMTSHVARTRPSAAKDVSMAGVAGTLGMLAEASGVAAILDVAAVPRPAAATTGDWLTCFPGFAMLTADRPGHPVRDAGPATTAVCGELVAGSGVRLRWPDGVTTRAVTAGVTGLGAA